MKNSRVKRTEQPRPDWWRLSTGQPLRVLDPKTGRTETPPESTTARERWNTHAASLRGFPTMSGRPKPCRPKTQTVQQIVDGLTPTERAWLAEQLGA